MIYLKYINYLILTYNYIVNYITFNIIFFIIRFITFTFILKLYSFLIIINNYNFSIWCLFIIEAFFVILQNTFFNNSY